MPSNWQSIDMNFPSFTGEESPKEQIQALHNYLFQLRQGLQYSLQNLGVKNFNATSLKELTDAQKADVQVLLQGVTNSINSLSGEVNGLSSRIRDMEKLTGQVADIEEWTAAAEEELKALSDRIGALENIIRVEEDGSVTIGTDGKILNFVGDVYINGVKWQAATEDETPPEDTNPEEETTPEEEGTT